MQRTNLGFFFDFDAFNSAILLLAFALDVISEIFVPVALSLPEEI